jgi:hypothetical protein
LPPTVLGRWLDAAIQCSRSKECERPWSKMARPEYVFWPSWPDSPVGRVEPDLALVFEESIVIVEAKLWSGKSGVRSERDQIARQWLVGSRHLAQTSRSARVVAHVYLTAHLTLPASEFTDSIAALKKEGCHDANLWWLSWATLAPLLADMADNPVASDLLLYLREVGVIRFLGWHTLHARPVAWRYESKPPSPYWRGTWGRVSEWRYRCGEGLYWSSIAARQPAREGWKYRGENR